MLFILFYVSDNLTNLSSQLLSSTKLSLSLEQHVSNPANDNPLATGTNDVETNANNTVVDNDNEATANNDPLITTCVMMTHAMFCDRMCTLPAIWLATILVLPTPRTHCLFWTTSATMQGRLIVG